MFTLFIDTHFTKVTLILYKDGKVKYSYNEDSTQSHSVITMPSLAALLKKANLNIRDISEIVVVNGPGSFTGVRIGVTIAKTISYTLNIPIKVISSLEVLASNLDDTEKIVAFNDRNGYFVGRFDKYNTLLEDYFYLNNNEYAEFKKANHVYDIFNEIDYNKVYKLIETRNSLNCHLVNPIYVKKIEVQK